MTRPKVAFDKVSVVIPARNEATTITRTIAAILSQERSCHSLEVIVVDDGSTDDTVVRARDAGAHVIRFSETGGNPAAARNRGAAASNGDPLIFLDADCEVADGWLAAFLRAHAAGETIVAGSLDLPPGLQFTAKCDYYCGWYLVHPRRPAGYVPHAPAPNLSVRRAAFLSTGGFDEVPYSIASEERKWQAELRQRGHKIYFEPQARAMHYNRPGLANLLLRNYRWGYAAIGSKHETGTARLAWLYRFPRLAVVAALPLAFVHAIFIIACWLRYSVYEPLLMLPLVLVSRFAYAAGMIAGGVRWLRNRDGRVVEKGLGGPQN